MTFSRTSPDHAHLAATRAPDRSAPPAAVCLVVHGGRSVSQADVTAWQFAVLRMRPLARVLARQLPTVAVYRLRMAVRGWNGTGATATRDARWAVARLRQLHPGVPIVLVGHSMGARTCLLIADEPAVVGVVGLASWLPLDEPVQQLLDVQVRLVHGDRDRIVSEPSTRAFVARLSAAGVEFRRTVLTGTGHGMIRRWRRWNAETVAGVQALLQAARSAQPAPADPVDRFPDR
ncbi:MAG: alpha/beta fold hydrolase [Nakamurella sp.]